MATKKGGTLQVAMEMDVAALRKDVAAINSELARGTKMWTDTLNGFASGFKSAFGIAGIGLVLTEAIAGIQNAVGGLFQTFSEVAEGAKRLGVSIEEYQRLKIIFENAGSSAAEMEATILSLNKAIGGLGTGAGKAASEALKAMGINAKEFATSGSVAQIAKIAEGITHLGSSAEIAAKMSALFGRNYKDILPVLDSGSRAILETAESAERLGLILSTEVVQAGVAFKDQLKIITEQGKGLLAQFLEPLLPTLTDIAKSLSATGAAATGTVGPLDSSASAMETLGKWAAEGIALVRNFALGLEAIAKIAGIAAASITEQISSAWTVLKENIQHPLDFSENWKRIQAFYDKGAELRAEAAADTAKIIATMNADMAKNWNTAAGPKVRFIEAPRLGGGSGGDPPAAQAIKKTADEVKKLVKEMDIGEGVLDDWLQLLKDAAPGIDRIKDSYADQAQNIRDMLDPLQALRNEQEAYDLALKEGLVSVADHATLTADVIARTREETEKSRQKQIELTSMLVDAGFMIGEAFAHSGKEGMQAMKDLTKSIIETIAKALILQFVMNMINGTSGGYGAAISKGFGLTTNPSSYSASNLGATTYGGVPVQTATASPANTQLGAFNQGMPFAATALNKKPLKVEVNNYGARVDVQQSEDTIRIVVDAVRNSIAGDVSSGGNPVAAAMERTYGLRR